MFPTAPVLGPPPPLVLVADGFWSVPADGSVPADVVVMPGDGEDTDVPDLESLDFSRSSRAFFIASDSTGFFLPKIQS